MSRTANPVRTCEITFGGWAPAAKWVAATFPDAKLVGMGVWKVSRVVKIYYGVGRVIVTPMRGHTLAEFGL